MQPRSAPEFSLLRQLWLSPCRAQLVPMSAVTRREGTSEWQIFVTSLYLPNKHILKVYVEIDSKYKIEMHA